MREIFLNTLMIGYAFNMWVGIPILLIHYEEDKDCLWLFIPFGFTKFLGRL